jgi:CRP-like cAMP-binding protein
MDQHKLSSLPLFTELDSRELGQVAQAADEVDVSEGKELLHEGAFAYEFMVIEDGRAEVIRDGEHVADLGPGDFLGEIAAMENGRRNASVFARSPMSLVVLTAHDLRTLASSMPKLKQAVEARATERHPLCNGQ